MTIDQKRAAANLRDSELIEKHKNGDAQAFPSLIKFHHDTIFSLCLDFLDSFEDAEDATQEIIITIFNDINSGKYIERQVFEGWLFVTTKHYLLQLKRKRKLNTSDSKKLVKQMMAIPDQEKTEELDTTIITQLLEKLPPENVELLKYRFWDKLSWKKIGELMDIGENSASGQGSKILKKLQKMMGENIFQKNRRIFKV